VPQIPAGFAPAVPGFTSGAGPLPGKPSPDAMLAMLMGRNPPQAQSTGDKMSQVVQLLREIGQQDPRLAFLTGDVLNRLISGPQIMQQSSTGGGPQIQGGPTTIPVGGPGTSL